MNFIPKAQVILEQPSCYKGKIIRYIPLSICSEVGDGFQGVSS